VIIEGIRHECGAETCTLSARVRSEAWSREDFVVWYRIPSELASEHGPGTPDASPFLPGFLPWCLRRAEPLRIEGPVSPSLLDRTARIVDVYRAFWPDIMTRVEVVAERREPAPGAPLTGSYFSRGVDSWYSVLSQSGPEREEPGLTHLVYVPSLDFMYDEVHRQRATTRMEDVTRALDLVPVIVNTNLRRHTETFLHWGYYSGAGLASIGLALGLRRMLVPAAFSYAHVRPEGTHAMLDPLWSTGRTDIELHGLEATRWDKLSFLLNHPEALRSLKVCFDENTDGNCGRCPKCLGTMIMLSCLGVLSACPFDVPLEPARFAGLKEPPTSVPLGMLRDSVLPAIHDPRLALAVRAALLRWSINGTIAETRGALTTLRSAAITTARRRLRLLSKRFR
jgi:hypothetical protein